MKIRNVPIHIGACELKQLIHIELSAKFQKGLKLKQLPLFPLHLDDVELCDKNGVPIDMRPQKDVIFDHFYQNDSKGNVLLKNLSTAPPIVIQLQVCSECSVSLYCSAYKLDSPLMNGRWSSQDFWLEMNAKRQ